MKSLCIKTNNSNLLDYLFHELKTINIPDICFCQNQFKHYKNIIIHYTGKDLPFFYSKMSSLLSLLIIDEVEDEILKKLILQNYFYFDAIERKKILEICYDITAENFTTLLDQKLNCLYENFYCYLTQNKSIILPGFINFRIKDYISILDNLVNEAVNSFLLEKEYLEFISLLKLYINSQSSNCNLVHLIYSPAESILLDENKEIIPLTDEIFKAKYLSDISFSNNDYILNTLLNLLPQKIYIHLVGGYLDEFIHTLQLVFENKTTLCTDCHICKIYKTKQNITSKK